MESHAVGDTTSCTIAASARNVISDQSFDPGTPQESDATEESQSSIQNRQSDNAGLAPVLIEDFAGSNVLLKFGRYQTQAQRSLYWVSVR